MKNNFWYKWLFVCFFLYLPGMIFYGIFPNDYAEEYKNVNNIYIGFFIAFLIFSFFSKLFFNFFTRINIRIKSFSKKTVIRFLFFLLLLSLYFGYNFFIKFGGDSFRHNHRFSDSGASSAIVFLFRSLIEIFLLFMICNISENKTIFKKGKILIFLSFIFLFLPLNSSLQVFVLFIPLILLFKPSLLDTRLNLKILSKYFLPTVIVMLAVLIFGIGNKIGYELLFSQSDLFSTYFKKIILRASTALVSVSSVLSNDFFQQGYEGLNSQIITFMNRFNLLTGNGFDSVIISTVDRTNYLNIFNAFNSRAGASPYILASMWYLPFGFGFLFIPAYFSFISSIIFKSLKKLPKIYFIRLFFIYLCALNLFESPLNIFLIFDAVPFRLLCIFSFFYFIHPNLLFEIRKNNI
jgi:hypothetical protein